MMGATDTKKLTSLIMAELTQHFGLGLRYDGDRLRPDDIDWLQEHQRESVNKILKALDKYVSNTSK